MFSKTCEYAIRAMIFIAHKSKDGNKVGIKEIAKGIDSPESFIAKILQDLSRKGLVQSLKGPNGGFYLDNKSLKCSLADIVTEVDGDKLFSGCGLGLKQCSESHPCPIHHEFKKVRAEIKQMLEKAKLGEFTAQLDLNLTFLRRK
ncbi:Rrf2 family transcriptional regulator [Chitinophaga sp. MM2321]|uniref:RrF2 family transcriptional regulator n=1 Tax=Chitinophaga sp. MM2321 TaxID=3137178 RepID=UPI0032D589B1